MGTELFSTLGLQPSFGFGDRIGLATPGHVEAIKQAGGGTAQVRFDVVVPQGRIFVMGDNRADSADSRYHLEEQQGTVPDANVVGRVVAVIWPVSRWSGEPIPSIFENPAVSQQKPVKPAATSGAAPSEEAQPEPGSS